MVGISDLIQTMGAIVIFSLILLTANRMILSNTRTEIQKEAERIAIGLGQSIINEAQTKPFDAETADGSIPMKIPQGFTSCGAGSGESYPNYSDFDDYHDLNNYCVDTRLGNDTFCIDIDVLYVSSPNFEMSSGSTGGSESERTMFKKMVVTIRGDYMEDEIKLSYLRRYYKTTN